ncbi:cyclophilin-like protein [Xylariomycetidae sp. FL0641]|nr:cyclophilin-like protein [Xylariomycetidae sp. FL0641]
MSSIYNLEPQPTASLILHTTQGDLSVELFAKQTPLTSRNFLQQCTNGYYDHTIFHRLVPGFIIQGGDPTGTGNGGESIYDGGAYGGDLEPWPMDQRRGQNAGPTGVNFKDEFHSRLKFNRRGLLGMANEGKPDTNGSQFFFTLEKAEELNGKNTVFGRVVGDTIYNLMRMGEADIIEGSDRPLYPVKITGVEILVNPFTDMEKTDKVAQKVVTASPALKKKKKKPKAAKTLLSFGDEEDDADLPVIKKAKFDPRIVMDVDDEPGTASDPTERAVKGIEKMTKASSIPVRESKVEVSPEREPSPAPQRKTSQARQVSSPPPPRELPKKKTALEEANEEIAALKASMKRTIHPEPVSEVKKSALEQLIPETSTRGRKRRRGGDGAATDDDMSMFTAFRSKLGQVGPEKQQPTIVTGEETAEQGSGEQDEETRLCGLHFIANCHSCNSWDQAEKEESDDEGWMSHSLSFAADKLGKDLSYRKKAEEELVVIDPREKAQTLKEERRAQSTVCKHHTT